MTGTDEGRKKEERMTNRRWKPIRTMVVMVAVLSLVAAACSTPGGEGDTTTPDSVASTTTATGDTTTTAGGDGSETTTADGAGEPLRIGVVVPLTGGLAAPGTDMKDGFDLFWENNPTEIAGRTIEYRVEDTGGVPETALQLVDELVQNYGAEIIVGPLLANVTLAMADRLKDNPDVIFMVPVGSADDLTQRIRDDYPNFIRAGGWTSSQPTHVLGDWAAKQGYETAATICTDYAFGHENCGGFVQIFTEQGGVVDPANQLWNPLGAQDFATYVTQLQGAGTDMVFGLQVGGSAGDFLSSWSDFGLKDQIPLIAGEVLTDVSNIRNLDPSIVEGIISSGHWAEGRDAPETQELVELTLEATDKIPSYYLAATWTAAQYIAAGVEETGGDTSDKQALLDVMRGLELETPFGPSRIDDYGNPIYDIYIREVQVRDDGRVWNVPIETYEDIDQFWPYEPEEYLQQPIYSREFQGNASAGD